MGCGRSYCFLCYGRDRRDRVRCGSGGCERAALVSVRLWIGVLRNSDGDCIPDPSRSPTNELPADGPPGLITAPGFVGGTGPGVATAPGFGGATPGPPPGATARCRDGDYSYSTHHSGPVPAMAACRNGWLADANANANESVPPRASCGGASPVAMVARSGSAGEISRRGSAPGHWMRLLRRSLERQASDRGSLNRTSRARLRMFGSPRTVRGSLGCHADRVEAAVATGAPLVPLLSTFAI